MAFPTQTLNKQVQNDIKTNVIARYHFHNVKMLEGMLLMFEVMAHPKFRELAGYADKLDEIKWLDTYVCNNNIHLIFGRFYRTINRSDLPKSWYQGYLPTTVLNFIIDELAKQMSNNLLKMKELSVLTVLKDHPDILIQLLNEEKIENLENYIQRKLNKKQWEPSRNYRSPLNARDSRGEINSEKEKNKDNNQLKNEEKESTKVKFRKLKPVQSLAQKMAREYQENQTDLRKFLEDARSAHRIESTANHFRTLRRKLLAISKKDNEKDAIEEFAKKLKQSKYLRYGPEWRLSPDTKSTIVASGLALALTPVLTGINAILKGFVNQHIHTAMLGNFLPNALLFLISLALLLFLPLLVNRMVLRYYRLADDKNIEKLTRLISNDATLTKDILAKESVELTTEITLIANIPTAVEPTNKSSSFSTGSDNQLKKESQKTSKNK